MAIPKPSGPYGVGSVTGALIDTTRAVHVESAAPGRRLILKVWYPAASTAARPELLWSELRTNTRTPLPMRLLLRCVPARSATVPGALFSPAVRASPLVLYNHGLISFAAENTSLMQELASHGYTVIAIEHADQLPERRAVTRRGSGGSHTNRVAVERSVDTSFAMDQASRVLAAVPGLRQDSVDTSAAHLVGFSLGGAVATVTAEQDSRALSVINLDGGMYGTRNARDLRVPYLMMYSAPNDHGNDRLLPDHAQRVAPAGTTHLNYHDIAALLPVLRYLRATGSTNASAFVAQRNLTVRTFLSTGGPLGLEPFRYAQH